MYTVIDERFESLIDISTEPELLASDFKFTEGPVWHSKEKCLYFSDIPANSLYRYDEKTGVSVFRKPSHFSNGLTLTKDGNLIICEHKSRSITLQTQNGFQLLADHYQGKKLNSPNDIIVSRNGTIFFSDPIYGLQEGFGGPASQEMEIQGVFILRPGEKELELLFDDFERPNGLAFNQDESLLFVIDTVLQHIRVFSKDENGNYTGGKVFAELWGEGQGRPDGMKLDAFGNVFCTGPGGVWVFTPKGDLLGKIHFEKKTANLAWGDDDQKSLFITSNKSLFRLRCKTQGMCPMVDLT